MKNKNITFEQWNLQFEDNNIDEFIPEYNMTLREFRTQIYEAEFSKGLSLNEFEKRLGEWKIRKKKKYIFCKK